MPLGFNYSVGGSGDILPIIKWDAKAGDLLRQDSYQAADGSRQKDVAEIPLPTSVAMDLGAIEVGWLSFATGQPDFVMAGINEPFPEKPANGDHKQAFRVRVATKELGLREFSHSAKTVLRALDELFDEYEKEAPAHHGKVPVVTFHSAKRVTVNTQQGELSFKVPEWTITDWIDRPELMDRVATVPSEPAPEVVVSQSPAEAAPSGNSLF